MSDDVVDNAESVYRSVPSNADSPDNTCYEYDKDNNLRIKSVAFNDRNLKPSVDRAKIRNHCPEKSKQQKRAGIIDLSVEEIRNQTIRRRGETNYQLDVKFDPLPENDAHALVVPTPEYETKNHFRKIREALARLATNHGWVIKPME